ncbi:MAG: hypothetical protein O3A87_08295 [Verrucomicrobia bacterium]|nr:hypothetical protein [Verrucomicrobiota bacterium]MDA1006463.1 hypothetical protein [Verrucomicrobiota bacterium]
MIESIRMDETVDTDPNIGVPYCIAFRADSLNREFDRIVMVMN